MRRREPALSLRSTFCRNCEEALLTAGPLPSEILQDLAETAGVFGETAAGVTLGALREALRQGAVGEHDRVVLLVTGDGLKTPAPVADRVRMVEIEPDADAVLELVGAAA